jgi:hypothetical protein
LEIRIISWNTRERYKENRKYSIRGKCDDNKNENPGQMKNKMRR